MKLKIKNINEGINFVNEIKEIYKMNQSELQNIAMNENESFVKRKFIKLLSSDDDKLSLEAIKYMHGVISGDNLEFDNLHINYVNEGINLSESQEKIYKKLYDTNNGQLMTGADVELLKLLAVNIDHFNTMKILNEATGFKMKFKNGAQQVRPEVTIMRDCLNNIQKLSNMLGLTTISKIKNNLHIETDSNDVLNGLLQ